MAMYHGYVSWLCIMAMYHGYVSWLCIIAMSYISSSVVSRRPSSVRRSSVRRRPSSSVVVRRRPSSSSVRRRRPSDSRCHLDFEILVPFSRPRPIQYFVCGVACFFLCTAYLTDIGGSLWGRCHVGILVPLTHQKAPSINFGLSGGPYIILLGVVVLCMISNESK